MLGKREEHTILTLGEQRYRIGSLDPMSGLYLGTKLLALLAPLFSSFVRKNADALSQLKDEGEEEVLQQKVMGNLDKFDFSALDLQSTLGRLTKKESDEIYSECLRCVEVELRSGWVPVLNKNGSWAYMPGMGDVLHLTWEVIQFNFMDFFDGLLPNSEEEAAAR